MPTYLREARHFTGLSAGVAGISLLGATVTSVFGGILSDRLTMRWNNGRRGRLTVVIMGYAIAAVALLTAGATDNHGIAIACLTIARSGIEMTVPLHGRSQQTSAASSAAA